jgi:hypothetical protein
LFAPAVARKRRWKRRNLPLTEKNWIRGFERDDVGNAYHEKHEIIMARLRKQVSVEKLARVLQGNAEKVFRRCAPLRLAQFAVNMSLTLPGQFSIFSV